MGALPSPRHTKTRRDTRRGNKILPCIQYTAWRSWSLVLLRKRTRRRGGRKTTTDNKLALRRKLPISVIPVFGRTLHPQSAMQASSSSLIMLSIFFTPSCPPTASEKNTGLPRRTAFAPVYAGEASGIGRDGRD